MAGPVVDVAAVVIGRNEGQRLIDCLHALGDQISRIVYVDSGSNDGSQQAAADLKVDVIALDMGVPFTAARARNAGIDHLLASEAPPRFIQLIDGDCVLQDGWASTAVEFLEATPDAAAAVGRLRERFPEATRYNKMADIEWDTPLGQLDACGGIVMMRSRALKEVGGFNPALIAGEEPELCVRLRGANWSIWRLDAEMALHDIAMTRFGQWWQRARRCGYTYAEGVVLHGAPPERHYRRELRSVLIWGIALPFVALIGTLVTPWALLVFLALPLQAVRLIAKGYDADYAVFLVIGKVAEAQGVLTYLWRRLRGQATKIIEYK